MFLIPAVIAEDTQDEVVTPQVRHALKGISHFLAEDIRSARRFLSSLKIYSSIESLHFQKLNKDTKASELNDMMSPLLRGENMGVISESGCPAVADPGSIAVQYAHQHSLKVVPLVGPSSILLALMASGLNGQRFAFHGYLPVDQKESAKAIKELERESKQKAQTQIFIETPYRNNTLFEALIRNLNSETRLCVAFDITGKTEAIITKTVGEWRLQAASFGKSPAIFLFLV